MQERHGNSSLQGKPGFSLAAGSPDETGEELRWLAKLPGVNDPRQATFLFIVITMNGDIPKTVFFLCALPKILPTEMHGEVSVPISHLHTPKKGT